jgi:hypothetical protein
MLSFIKSATLSLAIGATALTALPAAAQDGVYLNLNGRHSGVGVYSDDDNYGEYRDQRWRHDRRDDRWAQFCTPDRALDKAARMGIHRVRIADVNRRTITVAGRSRGDRIFVTFARAPRCPVVG